MRIRKAQTEKHVVQLKLRTGLKAGGDCPDMWREYQQKCGGNPAQNQGQGGNDPSWAERGMEIGRQFSGGWF